MKLSEKMKRFFVIGGGVVICVGLIIAISMQFGKAPAVEDNFPGHNPSGTEIVIDPGSLATETEEPGTEGKKMAAHSNTEAAAGSSETGQTADTRPAQTDQTEQSIQQEVTKPAEPGEEVKKDATQKPDGTKVDTLPTPVEHENVVTPAEPEPAPGQPQAGDTENGKIFIPGFGWVDNNGGGGSGITADDMYENGNKIGSMD